MGEYYGDDGDAAAATAATMGMDYIEDDSNAEVSFPWFRWGLLVIVSITSFWVQAVVTEERFVPCLNVIATQMKIPEDVAGATLMASGASSPELFAVLVTLFITHNPTLGIGTILGSEVFQQLCIVSGAILSSRTGELQLSRMTTLRESSFYALSLGLLWKATNNKVAISDADNGEDDGATTSSSSSSSKIYIHLTDAVLMLVGYFVYVVFCSHFDAIMGFLHDRLYTSDVSTGGQHAFGKDASSSDSEECGGGGGGYSHMEEGSPKRTYGDVVKEWNDPDQHPMLHVASMPFLRQVENEPSRNFPHSSSLESREERFPTGSSDRTIIATGTFDAEDDTPGDSRMDRSGCDSIHSGSDKDIINIGGGLRGKILCTTQGSIELEKMEGLAAPKKRKELFQFFVKESSPKPSKVHGLEEIEADKSNDTLSCFLWQQSMFYDEALVGTKAWQLRWFTFTRDGIVSVPNRAGSEKKQLRYPRFTSVDIDHKHLVLRLHSTVPNAPEYTFMAPTSRILKAVVSRVEQSLVLADNVWGEHDAQDRGDHDETATLLEAEALAAEEGPPIIALPRDGKVVNVAMHVLLFPIKILIHYSIPDVRHVHKAALHLPSEDDTQATSGRQSDTIGRAALAMVSSTAWLVVWSYVMCIALDDVGAIMKIPDAIMGITASAIGTSIPMLISSQVAAKQGLGNMAISNMLGSNIYNLLIALALPWALYAVTFPDDTATGWSFAIDDEGITESVLLLIVLLTLFLLTTLVSGFLLHRWHAYFFLAAYMLYLGYASFTILT